MGNYFDTLETLCVLKTRRDTNILESIIRQESEDPAYIKMYKVMSDSLKNHKTINCIDNLC